jgi:hypothetical protein
MTFGHASQASLRKPDVGDQARSDGWIGLYKIAHAAIFCDSSFGCLIQPDPAVGPRHHRIGSARNFSNPAIVLAACPKQSGCMGNDSTGWRIVPSSAFGGLMLTSKEYLQRAEECSQLANASSDVYVKKALTELASEFKATAKDLEQRNERWRGTDHGPDGKCGGMK